MIRRFEFTDNFLARKQIFYYLSPRLAPTAGVVFFRLEQTRGLTPFVRRKRPA
ncbi:MAG: hypothetical protein ACOY90_06100 [Candidatus Zhuqueibacterota bacterium]